MGNISEPLITLKFPHNYDYILHVLIVIMEIFAFMLLLFDLTTDLSTISGQISKYTNKTGN